MAVERAAGGTSLIDVLDRVLDKGIVIDAWVRVSLVGIDLITVEARVVVASIDTYLKYSEAVGQVAPVSRPAAELPSHQEMVAENAALRAELAASKSSRAELVAAAKKSSRADFVAAAKKSSRSDRVGTPTKRPRVRRRRSASEG
ncbi:MAG TPA: gas vesicle structural protein GvpA [Vicinamibacterales bacterium]|nr:gas vesicle structural protein GvpA [Vicinamibacterales bacterium]